MAEFRLNAVRKDTDETIAFIDLTEPVTSDRLVTGRKILNALVEQKYGEGALRGVVEIMPATDLPPLPDFNIAPDYTPSHLTLLEGN